MLTQICRHYMVTGQCPRFMNTEKIEERKDYVDRLAKEYKADGIIYEQMKFCDYWSYEDGGQPYHARRIWLSGAFHRPSLCSREFRASCGQECRPLWKA